MGLLLPSVDSAVARNACKSFFRQALQPILLRAPLAWVLPPHDIPTHHSLRYSPVRLCSHVSREQQLP